MKFIWPSLIVVLFFSIPSSFASEDWKLRKNKKNIQVYTRKVEGAAIKAAKVETIVEGYSLSSLVALLMDVEACPDWADRCAESYVHEKLSETESYVYVHNAMPYPIKDRDVLTRAKWSQDLSDYSVKLISIAEDGILPHKKKRLRLTEAKTTWHFIPKQDGSVHIINESHVNPGSTLPAWIINALMVDAPYKTMRSFIAEARKPKYRDAKVSFIQEPLAFQAQ